MRGAPIEVIEGKLTGLPIPATAEIAIEAELTPPETEVRDEGPFGEYTGYYGGAVAQEPVVHVKALYHRDSPILLGAPPFKPVAGHYASPLPVGVVARIWNELERHDISVLRVGSLVSTVGAIVVQIHQEDETHVGRVVEALTSLSAPFYRFFVVVEEDVDIENPLDVIWAIGTRCDPATQLKVHEAKTDWGLNPMRPLGVHRPDEAYTISRLVIDACRPYELLGRLSPVNQFSRELREDAWARWGHLLVRGPQPAALPAATRRG